MGGRLHRDNSRAMGSKRRREQTLPTFRQCEFTDREICSDVRLARAAQYM
jgi:hypothetical protein